MNPGHEGPSLAAWAWLADGPYYAPVLNLDKAFPSSSRNHVYTEF